MSNSAKLEKLVFTIGGETLDLTPEQAKQLYEQLYQLLGPVTVYTPFPASPSPYDPPYMTTCSPTMEHIKLTTSDTVTKS